MIFSHVAPTCRLFLHATDLDLLKNLNVISHTESQDLKELLSPGFSSFHYKVQTDIEAADSDDK